MIIFALLTCSRDIKSSTIMQRSIFLKYNKNECLAAIAVCEKQCNNIVERFKTIQKTVQILQSESESSLIRIRRFLLVVGLSLFCSLDTYWMLKVQPLISPMDAPENSPETCEFTAGLAS